MDIHITANRAQLPGLILNPKGHVSIEGRGTGKSFGTGFTIYNINRNMPRAVVAYTGQTYGQILKGTLPSALKLLEKFGYEKDVNYVIGRKPPAWFRDSYEKINKFDNVISFSCGTRFLLISLT
jgi:hypothetical protein